MPLNWHLGEKDFFAGMPEEKKAFLDLAIRRDLKKNDMVFYEDDPGESCFYLQTGLVKIFKAALVDKEPIYFLRRSGEMFGLAEVIDAKARKANAQAIAPCVLYETGKDRFEKFLAEHHQAARKIIKVMGRRLRFLGDQIESLMCCDVGTRLVRLLLYLSYEEFGPGKTHQTPIIVPVCLTQEQMASMSGCCQQTVSETLKRLQEENLITIRRKKITILNPQEFMKRAGYNPIYRSSQMN